MIQINEKDYAYTDGMTVAEAFRLACVNPNLEYLASVNGTFILRRLWDAEVLTDQSAIEFIPISTGG